MAVILGKRGRDGTLRRSAEASDSEDENTAKDLFRKAFEARFKPLPSESNAKPAPIQSAIEGATSDSERSDDDWDGFDNHESSDKVGIEVIDFRDQPDFTAPIRSEQRSFMSSRLPSESKRPAVSADEITDDIDDKDERANLKNDMALQRLLKESHLLKDSSDRSRVSEVQGRARLKALDLRIQGLGGKSSHLEQQNMPIAHRKGIRTKTTEREQKRRKDAADNGIVLERAKAAVKTVAARDRGIGGPSIGKFKGGMLSLSSKDVRSLQGNRGSGNQRRKRGR